MDLSEGQRRKAWTVFLPRVLHTFGDLAKAA